MFSLADEKECVSKRKEKRMSKGRDDVAAMGSNNSSNRQEQQQQVNLLPSKPGLLAAVALAWHDPSGVRSDY